MAYIYFEQKQGYSKKKVMKVWDACSSTVRALVWYTKGSRFDSCHAYFFHSNSGNNIFDDCFQFSLMVLV